MVSACQRGDKQAFKVIYEAYAPTLYGVCLRYAKDVESAQDILQDSFVKIFKNIGSFRNEGSLEGWVRRITVNTALVAVKQNKKWDSYIEVQEEVEYIEPPENDWSISGEKISEFIAELPDRYRLVFNLFAVEGYNHRQIGEMLGVKESTSRSQYTRARQKLLERIKKYQHYEK